MTSESLKQREEKNNDKIASWFDDILGYQVQHNETPDPIST